LLILLTLLVVDAARHRPQVRVMPIN